MMLVGAIFRGFGVAIIWIFSTTLLLKKLPNQVRGRVLGALMFTFGVYWYVNGVSGMKKVATPAAVE